MANKKKSGKKSKGFLSKLIFIISLAVLGGSAYLGFRIWQVYQPIVALDSGSYTDFFIYPDTQADKVIADLINSGIITNESALHWVAKQKGYEGEVKSGKYLIYDQWNANQLINTLRAGNQNPIKFILTSVRLVEELAGKMGEEFAPDSLAFSHALSSPKVAAQFGFDTYTFPTMFLPNTYEMYWNYSVDQVFGRMAKEYKKFWNKERREKAQQMNLTQSEVTILASIVKAETNRRDEAPQIAGVYVNRLKKGMPLQADPTLVFALGDFGIRRVLNAHKKIDSPYNTYMYKGLPPGPINIPELHYIDAVLNYARHSYYYFCAKEDFSGYSSFAKTYNDHLANARRYQRALSRRGIFK